MMTPDPPPAMRPRGSDWNSFMNTETTAGWTLRTSWTRASSPSLTGSAAAAGRARARAEAIRRCLRMGRLRFFCFVPPPRFGEGGQGGEVKGRAASTSPPGPLSDAERRRKSPQHPRVRQGELVPQVQPGAVRLHHDL